MSRIPLRPAINEASAVLAAAGITHARNDAEMLAAHLLGIERTRLALVPLIEPDVLASYRDMVARRAKRIPLQHITGVAAMGAIDVEVGPGVFVPRPETELLLAWALAFLEGRHAPVVVDLCTGSGALALAIAHARPDATVHAVEIDPAACEWAQRNIGMRAAMGDTPTVLHAGDVTDAALLTDLDSSVDVVVSNPPYVPTNAALEPEVADHDPHWAVFAGPRGLDVIAPMTSTVARLLRPGGAAGVEHDDSNGALVAEGFVRCGFVDVREHIDLAGKPRFVVGRRP
ncbi:peptide chain release factor N(5)-glutamine methyltransferase [Skermania sp. ID1734]|uniref:peptide chain release factor N(5)-glutamine methyltransferase n=1 Tax=Skermania sp. ID1734 TaxID=2597516 RepID=UPI00117FC36D|nr:peptide chain release factor N(5)-glutamine methyltransferase [Skermania sp. ID1734]TSD93901.1 peptide chain release factor N(5)-glutamine methyltransferase [Skermania sp. ID1734]